jgi:hypothetical protein
MFYVIIEKNIFQKVVIRNKKGNFSTQLNPSRVQNNSFVSRKADNY